MEDLGGLRLGLVLLSGPIVCNNFATIQTAFGNGTAVVVGLPSTQLEPVRTLGLIMHKQDMVSTGEGQPTSWLQSNKCLRILWPVSRYSKGEVKHCNDELIEA